MKNYFIICLLFFTGCKHDSDPNVVRQPAQVIRAACDTTSVTYSKDVSVILATYCYACHSGKAATAGLRLEEYNVVRSLSLNGSNDLVNSVNGTPDHIYMPPVPANKLTECEINKLVKWVNDGALNN